MVADRCFKRPDFRVLFVSQTARTDAPYLDPSVRYRCFNPAEVMTGNSVLADVVSQQNLTEGMMDHYDAFVFHRPYGGDERLAGFTDRIRSRNKRLVADYDDLIFAPDHALQSSIYLNGIRTEVQTRGIFRNNFQGLCCFDTFSVSTEPLKRHILALLPEARVTVVPNGLSEKLLAGAGLRPPVSRGGETPAAYLISYLSGTASHNPDFAFVSEALREVLARHPEYRLGICGPLEIAGSAVPAAAMLRFPHREYRDFFRRIRFAHVNIAPLAPGNVFNECKSGLKFFESGVWGVPTVASPIPDFLRFRDSAGLLLAETAEEWVSSLESLLDPEGYARAVSGLQEYCLEHCLATRPGMLLLNLLTGDEKRS